ncbi:MAG: hypothetical protein KC503_26075 [Myxococcales bacterium]|nr:hypothetical protein [Myxococcales bacterium]
MGAVADLKRTAVETLLAAEPFILVVLNPTVPGVKLPQHLIEARQPVPINIGYDMAIPVPDLEVGEEGISGTLSFNRSPFHCMMPWGALMQVTVGNEHLVWVIPPGEGGADDDDGGGGGGGSDDNGDDSDDKSKRAHLRLV